MIRLVVFIVVLSTSLQWAIGQNVTIGLFHSFNVKTLVFKPIKGSFFIGNNDGNKEEIKDNEIIYITLVGNNISVWGVEKHMGLSESLSITPQTEKSMFSLEPAFPALPKKRYEGSLYISIHPDDRLIISNAVPLDDYVAAVVEAESGTRATEEFYKSQAIISRTYALNHIDRHENDGYNLCDDVHCQVYKGLLTQNKTIRKAVDYTRGLVIIDETRQLITAAFHSNSGGYTINSEDVWSAAMPYLRGKKYPYWSGQHNSEWMVTVDMADWLSFLEYIGIKLPDKYTPSTLFTFNRTDRVRTMMIASQHVPLKDIRSHFNLKSTFFSIEPFDDKLVFKGRGYGHGVGLSQEGAMKMARMGKSYDEIIKFYYSNVSLMNIDSTTYLLRLLNK